MLPGLPFEYTAPMYAGHVSVWEKELVRRMPLRKSNAHLSLQKNNGSLFYWFCESQHTPATDPLVIWLNGG